MKAAAHVCPQGQAKGEGTAEAACVLGAAQGTPGQLRSRPLREASAQHPAHGRLSMSPRSLRPETLMSRGQTGLREVLGPRPQLASFHLPDFLADGPTSHRQDRVEPQSLSLRTDREAARLPCRVGQHLRTAPPGVAAEARAAVTPGAGHPVSTLPGALPPFVTFAVQDAAAYGTLASKPGTRVLCPPTLTSLCATGDVPRAP